MKVRDLIEKLKEAPLDSEVGFMWFGPHVIGSVEIGGPLKKQKRGYVLLYATYPCVESKVIPVGG